MNLFETKGFNGKFMRPNSSLPIAGTVASTAFNRVLTEVKVDTKAKPLFQGMSVSVAPASGGNAGSGLAPSILVASNDVTKTADAFVVDNANAVVLNGDDFPQVVDNQLVRVAMIGSGAEVYLPCEQTVATGTDPLLWDKAKQVLSRGTPAANQQAFTGIILSQVVDGIKGKNDNGTITTESCYVVKVKI